MSKVIHNGGKTIGGASILDKSETQQVEFAGASNPSKPSRVGKSVILDLYTVNLFSAKMAEIHFNAVECPLPILVEPTPKLAETSPYWPNFVQIVA
jgi:hypothetical protein